ncbi:MAG: hypothetical protein HC769_27015, partial [Cyanobacteria bacterium CRU_2_1]|nr:hypothetical protein [Cyanobacteria bacterium CRU_2_1]
MLAGSRTDRPPQLILSRSPIASRYRHNRSPSGGFHTPPDNLKRLPQQTTVWALSLSPTTWKDEGKDSVRSQLTVRLSGCQNLYHNTDRLHQSAPTGLLAGSRRRSPPLP